jgi:hypothetical protein
MNDRIKEIAVEQGIPWDDKYHWYISNSDLERFATLIIQECANIALREDHDPYECIMKEFGLETAGSTLRNRSTYYGNNP